MDPHRQRTRKRRSDPSIVAFIQRKRIEGWSISRIREGLESPNSGYQELPGGLPGERTIRDIAGEVAAQDRSGPWTLKADQTGRADLVLPALAAAKEITSSLRTQVTNDEARWIALLRQGAPSLPPDEAWKMARRCIAAEQKGEPPPELEEWLAFELWTPGGIERWADVIKASARGRGWRDPSQPAAQVKHEEDQG